MVQWRPSRPFRAPQQPQRRGSQGGRAGSFAPTNGGVRRPTCGWGFRPGRPLPVVWAPGRSDPAPATWRT